MILPVCILKLHSKEFYSRQFINIFLQTFTGKLYLIFCEKQEIQNTQRSPDIINLDVFSYNKRNPVFQQFCRPSPPHPPIIFTPIPFFTLLCMIILEGIAKRRQNYLGFFLLSKGEPYIILLIVHRTFLKTSQKKIKWHFTFKSNRKELSLLHAY